MASKKARALIEKVNAKRHQWTFETKGTPGIDFVGHLKDEKGKNVVVLKDDEDFNQLSRLLNTSRFMKNQHDMKGLAAWVWDRNLIILEEKERAEWTKKKVVPIDIREISVV